MSEIQRSDAPPAYLPSTVSGGAIREKERRRWPRPWRHALGALWLLAGAAELPAQTTRIRSAPPGVVETGVPTFTASGPEAIGLKSPPTDLHVLSDGRVLLFTRTELAIGDGQRWEVIRKAEHGGDELGDEIDTRSVAVDADDSIYIAITGGFARVEFGEDGFWRLRRVAPYPPMEDGARFPLPTQVVMTRAEWFWHSSGSIMSWRPGQNARFVVFRPAIERIFAAPGGAYVSNLFTNQLEPLHSGAAEERAEAIPIVEAITCSAPLDENHAFVGTASEGIKIFDGASLRPFVSRGLLAGGRRINDLCVTEPGLYAAALDMVGLVFFDRSGKIVQVLDRGMDYRLARVERVVYAAGVVWALSSDGIARVQFPARISNMEWLVPTALTNAQPVRFEGRLWVLADGRVHRGVYDELQRLVGFENMSLPGRRAHTLSVVTGSLLATNEEGIYRLENDRWLPVATGIRDARIEVPSHDGRRWVYFARGEYGWLTKDGNDFSVQRIHDPRFDHVFLVEVDAQGDAWLELGAGKFGRARLRNDVPALEVFDHLHGPADTWVNIFLAEGEARLNLNGTIYRLNEERRQLVQDHELLAQIPDLGVAIGRPAKDPRGRLWVNARGTVKVLDLASGNVKDSVERMPPGLDPYVFTIEDDGVVWLHGGRRLARFDPSMPEAPEMPLRAVIARLTFTARNRTIFNPPAQLSAVAYADNAIALDFAAPGNSLGQPVVFDVKLDGADEDWTATGAGGTAVFNHLKEGGYLLRVRPRAGALVGTEATLAFTVSPPWYRSPVAYFAYVLSGIVLAVGTVRGLAYLERRDRARLERLVVQRTAELNDTNRRLEQQVDATVRKAEELQVSEDRYRRLSAELEQRVAARTAELHDTNERLVESNQELEAFSYSVSHDLRAPLRNISGFAALLKSRADGHDDETRHFLDIVANETVRLDGLIGSLLTFSQLIRADINHQPIELAPLIEAVRAELASDASGRTVEWRIGALPTVYGDPTLLRQVFANLLANALKFSRGREPAVIEIGALPAEGAAREHILYVRDNGAGFDPKRADKLFGVFQRLHSAREFEGTGIGLATVRRIVGRHGGRVWAEGARGAGATFYFSLPQPASAPEPAAHPIL